MSVNVPFSCYANRRPAVMLAWWKAAPPCNAPAKKCVARIAVLVLACALPSAASASVADEVNTSKLRPQPAPRIAECGVASVYGMLTEVGIRFNFEELVERFQRVHGDGDLSSLSIQELVDVLHQYGVNASAVRFESAAVEQVPVPAILYTAPRFSSEFLGTGHFAVLVDVNDDFATIIDLSIAGEGREDGVVPVHKGRLRGVWKGEAIVLSAPGFTFSRVFTNYNLTASALVLSALSLGLGASTWRQIAREPITR